jgi:hypothetical protein
MLVPHRYCSPAVRKVEVPRTAIQPMSMSAVKTIPISFRVSPEFKALLLAAAKRENRSQVNMLEHLLFEFCREKGVTAQAAPQVITKKK